MHHNKFINQFLAIVLLITCALSLYGQNETILMNRIEKCDYEVKYRVTFNYKNFLDHRIYTLLIGENYALYTVEKRLTLDSLIKASPDPYMKRDIIQQNPGIPLEKILFSRKDEKIYVIDRPLLTYLYFEDIHTIQWKILNEKTIKMGIVQQKATSQYRGRDYVAWFMPDLPIPVGPGKFHGLPGLISRIEDSEGIFSIEIISFKKTRNRWIDLYQKDLPELTTRKEFRLLLINLHKNPEIVFRSLPGLTFSENFYENLKPKELILMEILEE
jgi:GLPGLI family protein